MDLQSFTQDMVSDYWKFNIPMTRIVRLLVGRLVGRSVGRSGCHSFLKGRELSLQWSYWRTCLSLIKLSFGVCHQGSFEFCRKLKKNIKKKWFE